MIKWSSLDGVCTDFSRALKLEIEKMGTLKNKWGPNGDPKSEKRPHGDPGPQMGTHVGAVDAMYHIAGSLYSSSPLRIKQYF